MKEHMLTGTKRERVEEKLLRKFRGMEIFEPEKHFRLFKQLQDGSFGFSPVACALYANGFNPRGASKLAPFGLIYSGDQSIFSMGYFRKEGTAYDEDGYLMIVAPKGIQVGSVIQHVTEEILADSTIPCKGVYVRFIGVRDYPDYVFRGFNLVGTDNNEWNPRAPQEDETYFHSTLDLSRVIRPNFDTFEVLDLGGTVDKEHRRKSRLAFKRFENFLRRNGLEFRMEKITGDNAGAASEVGRGLICAHFAQLTDPVGSVAEDHLGVVSPQILSLPDVKAYVGHLNNIPISIFVGEEIGPGMVGLYTPFTLRSSDHILKNLLRIDPNELIPNLPEIKDGPKQVPRSEGFSAIAVFNQIQYFAKIIIEEGISYVKLGGSEEKKLDDAKRQLGAEEDRTLWVFKGKV
ncbi:Uncharacterised protein [Candidatus Bilamarchaeum dharawalense]|uniref:Uncharacterized protein n=1 Tax=Candidatus Bilamarchaeum dharawalense TaxID=2885759 RepID=A0A5E4LW60_9ARCH|nr:Uncharacterised protein [Candidatus Bilamarchaeum dharawalense]